MTIYDAAMIGVVIAGMVWGALRGITWQLASIASLVLGYSVAYPLSGQLAHRFPGEPVVARALAMLAVYIGVSGGIFLAAWIVRTTLQRWKFDAFDRHLGMILGGLEGALLGVVATLFVVSLAPRTRETILTSPTGTAVNHLMTALGPILPGEIRDVLSPFDHPSDPIAAAFERVEAGPHPGRAGPRTRTPSPRRSTISTRKGGRASVARSSIRPSRNSSGRGRRGTGRPGPPTRNSSPRRSTICTRRAGRASVARSSTRPSRNSNEHAGRMTERLSVGNRAINLTQVLKLAGWALHGGEAKALISEGLVLVNGAVELRKRRKMALGDTVAMQVEGGPSLILVEGPAQPEDTG